MIYYILNIEELGSGDFLFSAVRKEKKMGIRENFKRGSIEMLILYLLTQEDMYGYQLAQEINSRSDGQFDITEGSMYPTLYRLIEKNAISDYKKLSGKRRTRVYYHIEKEGVELLEKIKEDYHAINAGVEKILSGKTAKTPAPKPTATKTTAKTSTRGRKKKTQE